VEAANLCLSVGLVIAQVPSFALHVWDDLYAWGSNCTTVDRQDYVCLVSEVCTGNSTVAKNS